jgi:hypothetical protein
MRYQSEAEAALATSTEEAALFTNLRTLVRSVRQQLATSANATYT